MTWPLPEVDGGGFAPGSGLGRCVVLRYVILRLVQPRCNSLPCWPCLLLNLVLTRIWSVGPELLAVSVGRCPWLSFSSSPLSLWALSGLSQVLPAPRALHWAETRPHLRRALTNKKASLAANQALLLTCLQAQLSPKHCGAVQHRFEEQCQEASCAGYLTHAQYGALGTHYRMCSRQPVWQAEANAYEGSTCCGLCHPTCNAGAQPGDQYRRLAQVWTWGMRVVHI